MELMERKRTPTAHQPTTHKAYETTEAREAVPVADQHRWLAWVEELGETHKQLAGTE